MTAAGHKIDQAIVTVSCIDCTYSISDFGRRIGLVLWWQQQQQRQQQHFLSMKSPSFRIEAVFCAKRTGA